MSKSFTAISGSNTKIRAEQIKSELGLTTLAGDIAALTQSFADIVGAAWDSDLSGYQNVQLTDLAAQIDAGTAGLFKMKVAAQVTGTLSASQGITAASFAADGKARVGTAQVDNLNVNGGLVFTDASGNLDNDSGFTFSGGVVAVTGDVSASANVKAKDVFAASLTSGRVAYAGANGKLVDNSGLTFDGTDLIMASAKVSDLTSGRIVVAGGNGALQDSSSLAWDGTDLIVGSAKVSDLTSGRVVIAGANGALMDDGDMTYDSSSNVLTVGGSTFGQNVTISGNLTVQGTTTQVDTTELIVKDAKVVISSGSIVEGAGIYLGSDASVDESIRWTLLDGGKWIASDKLMADTLQAGDLSSAFVYADGSGNLVEASASDIGLAVSGAIKAGTGVSLSYGSNQSTIAIGQAVATSDSVTFAAVTGSNLSASRLMASNANKGMASVANLSSWIAGTYLTVTDDGDGSVTLALPQAITTNAIPQFEGIYLGGNTVEETPMLSYADGYVRFGDAYGNFVTVADGSNKILSGFTATSIVGALNELKTASTSAAASKFVIEVGSTISAGSAVTLPAGKSLTGLTADNGMVFVNGQLMLSGSAGAKDYSIDTGALKFSFDLEAADVVVVQKA